MFTERTSSLMLFTLLGLTDDWWEISSYAFQGSLDWSTARHSKEYSQKFLMGDGTDFSLLIELTVILTDTLVWSMHSLIVLDLNWRGVEFIPTLLWLRLWVNCWSNHSLDGLTVTLLSHSRLKRLVAVMNRSRMAIDLGLTVPYTPRIVEVYGFTTYVDTIV